MPYVPALDGLRAVAILAVMFFHLGFLPIGWMGVPLFFVLSGYLITGILIRQRKQPLRQYLLTFYWRRTLRIFPLYYAYLAVNAALCVAMSIPLDGYWWFVAYLGNHRIGNTMPDVPGGIIGHLWSLAVEEQFYLLWPLIVFFVPRLWAIAAATILAAPLVREAILVGTGNPYLAVLTLPSCMDMLAAGALVAIVPRFLGPMALLGAAIVAWCAWQVPVSDFALTKLWAPEAHMLYTGLALLFAPLMHLAPRLRLLTWKPLVWTGRISYGLYMWHLLAFRAVHELDLGPIENAVCGLVLTVAVATVSWVAFERPILRLKDRRFGPTPVQSGSGAPHTM
jgi:peptidoglycan/LPS O-acetylase OafA/YrhL